MTSLTRLVRVTPEAFELLARDAGCTVEWGEPSLGLYEPTLHRIALDRGMACDVDPDCYGYKGHPGPHVHAYGERESLA